MKLFILSGITLLLLNWPLGAQTISEWRMDHRTGVTSESGLLTSWPESGPELLWTNLELPKGFSSLSFGGNSMFLTGIDGKTDILVALDLHGNIKWKTAFGRSWTQSYPDSRGTPTVENDRVYVASGSGDLACVNASSGQIIWAYKASEIHKGTFGSWGIAESLILDGDQLYFTPGGPETTTIALDKNSGRLIWASESLNDNPGYVSPILVSHEGRKLLINVIASYVYAIDPSTGSIVWRFKHLDVNDKADAGAKSIKCVTPLYHDGKIYVTGGYDHGGIMLDLVDGGNNVKIAWIDEVLDVHHGGVVLLNGYLYGANWLNNGMGNWCCLEWETGKKMYEERWNCKGSIISAEGMLYIYDEKRGNVGLVRANPEKFDLVSTFRITEGSGPYWSHPSIHNGVLYLRHGNALMAYQIRK